MDNDGAWGLVSTLLVWSTGLGLWFLYPEANFLKEDTALFFVINIESLRLLGLWGL